MKFYSQKSGDSIRILDESRQRFDTYFIEEFDDVLKNTKAEKRVLMSVLDLRDQKNKTLSLPDVGYKNLLRIIECERLIQSQIAAARRFKRSKLQYRRNRNA